MRKQQSRREIKKVQKKDWMDKAVNRRDQNISTQGIL